MANNGPAHGDSDNILLRKILESLRSGDGGDVNVINIGGEAIDLGQKPVADSVPVVLASGHPAIPVTGVGGAAIPVNIEGMTINNLTVASPDSVEDLDNDYDGSLASGVTDTGGWVETLNVSASTAFIKSDYPGTAYIEFSKDGVTVHGTSPSAAIPGGGIGVTFGIAPSGLKYSRRVYVQGATTGNVFIAILHHYQTPGVSKVPVGTTTNDLYTGSVALSHLKGRHSSGAWLALAVDATGALSLPVGAATSALQTAGNASLTSIDTKTPALGQALAAASVPVVLTAAQLSTLTPLASVSVSNFPATQPVSAVSLPLPAGASTSALQTTGNSSLSSIDGKLPALVSGRVPTETSEGILSGLVTGSARYNTSGTNTIVTPGGGQKVRLLWFGMSAPTANLTEVLAIVKLGASSKVRWSLPPGSGFAHKFAMEGANGEALVLDLSSATNVDFSYAYVLI